MKKLNIDFDDATFWREMDWGDPVVPDILKKTDGQVNRSRATRIRNQDPEYRARQSAAIIKATKEAQSRPEVIAKRKEVAARPETKARRIASAKEANARPEVKQKISMAQKEAHARPEVIAKRKEAYARAEVIAKIKEANARPEIKARRIAAAKEANARPEVKAKQSAAAKEAALRPEVKARRSAAQKEAAARPEIIAKRKEAQLSLLPAIKTPLGYFETLFLAGKAYPSYRDGNYYVNKMMKKDPENFYKITREEYNEYVKGTK